MASGPIAGTSSVRGCWPVALGAGHRIGVEALLVGELGAVHEYDLVPGPALVGDDALQRSQVFRLPDLEPVGLPPLLESSL